jgi:ribosomal protein S18 acetylase RimI-like enzyme
MAAELIIRPARPEDRGMAERICTKTWDWGDYIAEVWDEWLADEQGHMAVGELDGQIVALGRVRLLAKGQAWLEGMRVDPGYRRQGIAWRFFLHKLAHARAHGARIVRLGTSGQNRPVHSMMERAGMQRVGRYEMLAGPALPDSDQAALPGSRSLVQLSPQHAGPVHSFLRQSPVLAAARGLFSLDWAWETLSEARADELAAAGQLVGQWGSAGNLSALAVVQREPDDERIWVGFADAAPLPGAKAGPAIGRQAWPLPTPTAGPVAGPPAGAAVGLPAELHPEALRAFAWALRGLAHRWELKSAVVMLPDLPPLREAFRSAGYGPAEWQGELWIYEMPLDPFPPTERLEEETSQETGLVDQGAGNSPEIRSRASGSHSAVLERGM